MKFFVTGVGGQIGHDVMNELLKRGYIGIGSDIQKMYPCYYPTNRSIKALIKNTIIAWKVLHKHKKTLRRKRTIKHADIILNWDVYIDNGRCRGE